MRRSTFRSGPDNGFLREALRLAVSQDTVPSTVPTGESREAAVLCPVIDRGSRLNVVLTRRSEQLKVHAGQISFPGGKIDVADASALDAALREAREEIGLDPSQVEVIGALTDYDTSTGFSVSPFVGLVDPAFVAVPCPAEVEEVFEVPLAFLVDLANHREVAVQHNGKKHSYFEIRFERHRIWGATAGMLRDLAERLARTPGFPRDPLEAFRL